MSEPLNWSRDRHDWPHASASRFVQADGLRWHVQQMGRGPVALLLHGTGASTHSWRGWMERLAGEYCVVAVDLPGHAFTGPAPAEQLSLRGMARSVGVLVRELGLDVELLIGHSAGAAIGAQMVIGRHCAPTRLVGINGAFFPLAGLQGLIFPPVARLMAATPFASRLFARRTWDSQAVRRLIAGTGSVLDEQGIELYGRLLRDPHHAAGALGMMARWDLRELAREFRNWRTPLTLIVGARDRAVPPDDARRLLRLLPSPGDHRLEVLPQGGHLVHEEYPQEVAQRVLFRQG